uniref:NADH-ubiquinone oxidoreductase chain 3 n=1 Tax=Malachiinae sp. GENSP01 TaxID=1205562 RepID=A0A0S2MQP6_9CUCU|nr:NADH deshydrogenase subunit 3 [Malachiinae sp. GENSP01]
MIMLLFWMFLLIMMISTMLMLLASTLSMKIFIDREKNSSFECGFDPKSNFRMPFSLHFYLIAIIFLIFDVEITLFFPLIVSLKTINLNMFMMVTSFLIIILLLGLYHEWKQGCLNWSF